MSRKQFNKRFYQNPLHLIQDVTYILTHAPHARALVRRNITPAFRERLMLTVTAVNACRYCAYFHTRLALATGIEHTEIEQILGGVLENVPERERVALAYAQHWAETNAQPDPAVRAMFVATYGDDTARAIELVLRMIRVGNLMGNTFDYVLYRLSFGRYGAASPQQKIALHDTSA
jgi:AhpD family alkylhydroperoxidase